MFKRKFHFLMGALLLSGLGLFAQSASANTIQPIFMSVSGPSGGHYTYTYDLQLTPNNGLSNNAMFPSSLTIVDFGNVVGVPTLSFGGGLMGADATASGDWSVLPVTSTGTNLPNTIYVPTTLTLNGSGTLSVKTDDFAASNVTVVYVSSTGLASTLTQRSLVQLTIVSDLAPGPVLQSLSMNTALGSINEADSFPVITSTVPVPAAAWAGFSMLGGLGAFGAFRRRRTA